MTTLSENTVPVPLSDVQLAVLPQNRVLVRHAGGLGILNGIDPGLLKDVLASLDGKRTVAELCRDLAPAHDPQTIRETLTVLCGKPSIPDQVRENVPTATVANPAKQPEPCSLRVLVLGNGAPGRILHQRLNEIGIGADFLFFEDPKPPSSETVEFRHWPAACGPNPDSPRQGERCVGKKDLADALTGKNLLVVALAPVAYRTLYAVQKACIGKGTASLGFTHDPDGIRIGPVTVPGMTACFGCVQQANLRFLRLSAEETRRIAEGFQGGPLPDGPFLDVLVRAIEQEAGRLAMPEGSPRLFHRMLLLTPRGTRGPFHIFRDGDCPVCGRLGTDDLAEESGLSTGIIEKAAKANADEWRQRPKIAAEPAAHELCRSVGILGGGTAGYLAALALQKKHPQLRVTLIESSQVPIIGVGEATTPLMPQFLHVDLGLDIVEFFREVQPTFKLGIGFRWGLPGTPGFNYPFGPVRVLEPWRYEGHLRNCSLSSARMEAGTVPLEAKQGQWRGLWDTGIAYHLENRRFVRYLQRKAQERGVVREDCTIDHVETDREKDEITALIDREGRRFTFDFYVDCSGFRSMLIEDCLGSEFVDFRESLFTDRAVVAAVPHGGEIKPYTLAEAMSAGWCWNTPQMEEDHRGYVFCSAFQEEEAAIAEMRARNPGMGEHRIVRFRAGRHAHFWKGNAVALGNAYGFVEPLESTALHMLIRQIGLFTRSFPIRLGERGMAAVLNRKVNAFWDYLRWFLAIHYKFNRKWNTPFWKACREETDVSGFEELLTLFRERGPLSYNRTAATAFEVPDPLWGAEGLDLLLFGQEVDCRLPEPIVSQKEWLHAAGVYGSLARTGVNHARALDVLRDDPTLLREFAAVFHATGPAF